jgi:hypothetical protein
MKKAHRPLDDDQQKTWQRYMDRCMRLHRQLWIVGTGKEKHGIIIHGDPGTGKSYQTELGVTAMAEAGLGELIHKPGHVTIRDLAQRLKDSPQAIHFLEDVGPLLLRTAADELLNGVLYGPRDDKGDMVRWVDWGATRNRVRGRFHGKIVITTNYTFTGRHTSDLASVLQRLVVYHWDPSQEELLVLMIHLCNAGYQSGQDRLTPQECHQVLDVYLANRPPGYRRILEAGFGHHLAARNGVVEDWVETYVDELYGGKPPEKTPAQERMDEHKLALDLRAQLKRGEIKLEEMLSRWAEATGGKGKSSFYRAVNRNK